eukprot:COSAG06_NODE_1248_length_10110_cov_19.070223_11_plen_131_part_00
MLSESERGAILIRLIAQYSVLYRSITQVLTLLTTVYHDIGPEGTPRWGCALPLGPPVPSLGGVCALSAVGAAVASVPCLGQCAVTRLRIPGESKLPRHGSNVAVIQNSNIGLTFCRFVFVTSTLSLLLAD